MKRSVVIFAKPPRMGLSKTRLAAGMGRAQARRIACFSMAKTLRAVNDPRWNTTLYATPDTALRETLGGIWPPALPRASQGHGDLGDRLQRGLSEAPRGQVVFIGADTPGISRARIWQAFTALRRHDGVFGPARDGGFWLFGVNTPAAPPALFQNVRWSTRYALADVRANFSADARIAMLDELIDLDTARDWRDWNRLTE